MPYKIDPKTKKRTWISEADIPKTTPPGEPVSPEFRAGEEQVKRRKMMEAEKARIPPSFYEVQKEKEAGEIREEAFEEETGAGALQEELKGKIDKASKTIIPTNCIGTALFLAGLRNEDVIEDKRGAYDKYLKKLDILKKPRKGCFISWEKTNQLGGIEEVVHLGIVSGVKPLTIIHRKGKYLKGKNAKIYKQDFHIQVNKTYWCLSDRIRFYSTKHLNTHMNCISYE